MARENLWRAVAVVMCAALPAGFYVLGDVTDAFPGVLTTTGGQERPVNPPAQGESLPRASQDPLAPTPGPELSETEQLDLQRRLDRTASQPVVDGHLAFSVVDAASGTTLASRDADTARTPASTLKLLTAATALKTLGPNTTLPTTVVLKGRTLTLVGGGDMMLSRTDLGVLADRAVDLARKKGSEKITLQLDDTLFPDDGINSAWGNNGPAGGWVTPSASLALDEGWLDGEEYGPKSTDPAGDAAKVFASALEDRGLEVTGKLRRDAAPKGGDRAEIRSAPIRDIVAHTLLISDNTTAELLARLTAAKEGRTPDAAGGAAAVRHEVESIADRHGIPTDGLRILDGNGLSRRDALPPALLAAGLADIVSAGDADLRQILTDVPIAGLTGTLQDRFGARKNADARGIVRGKTGYLGGSATLAGIAVMPSGRTVAFSIVVHGFDGADADAARAAVDRVAATLVEQS